MSRAAHEGRPNSRGSPTATEAAGAAPAIAAPPESAGGQPGRLVRDYRRAAGLTRRQLAGRAGVSVYTIWALESGHTAWPTWETLQALARGLAIEVMTILWDCGAVPVGWELDPVPAVVLGRLLRRLRQKAGLTLQEMAQRVRVSTGSLSRCETGAGRPSLPVLAAIAEQVGAEDGLVGLLRQAGALRGAAAPATLVLTVPVAYIVRDIVVRQPPLVPERLAALAGPKTRHMRLWRVRAGGNGSRHSALAVLRRAAGWTQEELAARVGIARPTLSKVEAGRKSCRPRTAYRLARAVGRPVQEIFVPLHPGGGAV